MALCPCAVGCEGRKVEATMSGSNIRPCARYSQKSKIIPTCCFRRPIKPNPKYGPDTTQRSHNGATNHQANRTTTSLTTKYTYLWADTLTPPQPTKQPALSGHHNGGRHKIQMDKFVAVPCRWHHRDYLVSADVMEE